ncbi:hypothetical protein [Aliikangiella coralliicola]|uniref:Uncharacterized protein n=1 Tax=Aliikangiella coralliicola TaxID=2592383 RepID=A0A545UGA7_9GAMM|nr:hypothetical protein [Aliikangiella coralliicola]TQV88514.1 hypothetical protein FLL46_08305 [Aliikangiella coralliicola]
MHKPKGAGGTSGGVGRYLIGLIMMSVGGYLFLSKIMVTTGAFSRGFGMGTHLYSIGGGFGVTGGMILIPFFIGIVMIFWNSKNILGWLLSGLSIVALIAGIIANIRMTLVPMSAFDIIVLIVLMAGGAGMFFSSLKNFDSEGQQ